MVGNFFNFKCGSVVLLRFQMYQPSLSPAGKIQQSQRIKGTYSSAVSCGFGKAER